MKKLITGTIILVLWHKSIKVAFNAGEVVGLCTAYLTNEIDRKQKLNERKIRTSYYNLTKEK